MQDKPVVLILEDQENWRDMLGSLLKPDAYEVVVAASLTEAVSLIRSRVIDAAIVDICLKEGDRSNVDGMRFIELLEKQYHVDRSHAVMLSGHGTMDLAIKALTQPSGMVINFFRKDKLDANRFLEEIARAIRASQAEREDRNRARTARFLPSTLLESLRVDNLIAHLAPQGDLWDIRKDIGVILRQLLLNVLPLASEVRISLKRGSTSSENVVHILCWSRQLICALDVSIGRRGAMASLQSRGTLFGEASAEKLTEWSTRYFDGVVFQLKDVSFDHFAEMVTSQDNP